MEISLEVESKAVKKETEQKQPKSKIDKLGRAYATGKRKTSIARVWLKKGKGQIIVNGKELTKYFSDSSAESIVNIPLEATGNAGKVDIKATVEGGGITGQIAALKHGISKALAELNPEAFRSTLRKSGLLTRDARKVERKKYGRKKARKSFQFSKR